MSLQTRLSLVITAVLVIVGAIGFWWLEHDHLLRETPVSDGFLAACFQSVTTRTAGFNTVPIGELQQSTLVLMIGLMIIGGCPVSTAGGIKTVTFGVLLLNLRAALQEKERVEARGRTLPPRVLLMASNVVVLYAISAGIGIFLLSALEPHLALRDILFEVISALSTVGLSTGITAGLGVGAKLVLCAAMFIGRLGPLALVLAIFSTKEKVNYEFPTENVMVG